MLHHYLTLVQPSTYTQDPTEATKEGDEGAGMMTVASTCTDQSNFAVAVPAEWAVTAPPTNPPSLQSRLPPFFPLPALATDVMWHAVRA